MVIWVNFFQTELTVEICSKSLVRAMGKVLLIKLSHKGDEKWPLVTSIKLDNNNAVFTDL